LKEMYFNYSRLLNFILLVIIGSLLFVMYHKQPLMMYMEVPPPKLRPDAKDKGLFVNTTHCRMEAMDPLSPTALHFMVPMLVYVCYKVQLLKGMTIEGRNYLFLTHSRRDLWQKLGIRRLNQILCAYNIFVRIDDFENRNMARVVFSFSRGGNFTEVKPGNTTLRVVCWLDFGRLIFHDVIFFLSPPKIAKASEHNEKSVKRLSVLVLGIDSISHMHYRRYFSHVIDYVSGLPHVELWGYNRIGRNSYPNLLPLLSGQNEEEVEGISGCYARFNWTSFDQCHFLWDDFKAAGYATAFGEDTRIGGTFTFEHAGFWRQPAEFYLRSVMNEVHQHTHYMAHGTDDFWCSGGRVYHDILYDFIDQLLPHFKERSRDSGFFAFFWQSQGIHDIFEYAGHTDRHYYRILRALNDLGIFENSLVLLMSDHGLRFGGFAKTLQGLREISLPTLVAIYPHWLQQRFPMAVANLQKNAHRLVTTYDLHETLKDVMDLDSLSDQSIHERTLRLHNQRNVSLFLPIPEERSCESSQIWMHYCQCDGFALIPKNENSVLRVAKFAVARINELLRPYPQCQKLDLLKVKDAYLRVGAEVDRTITVRLVTMPGKGTFDVTALTSNLTELQGEITRTDRYKMQSYCARGTSIEIYCYCL
ncbi:hypothetical protein KR009_007129, partial [Drosophila setifemur]